MRKLIVIISIFIGFIAGSIFLYIGFKHNSQGEFFNSVTRDLDGIYCLVIFISWFLVVSLATFILLSMVEKIVSFVRKL